MVSVDIEVQAKGALPPSAALKLDLLFNGVRFSSALGAAAGAAYPNFFPYRFAVEEARPTDAPTAAIPYLLTLDDGTTTRIKGQPGSPFWIDDAHHLRCDDTDLRRPITFAPRPAWFARATADGTPMPAAGLSLHRDMGVINVAPGCQYFTAKAADGASLRCTFCTYGAPDARMASLGQDLEQVDVPNPTIARLADVLEAALSEGGLRTLYLVGGSMRDWHEEGRRFVDLARCVRELAGDRVTLSCGSGALPDDALRTLKTEGFVDSVCFNLEVWDRGLFERICPGKAAFVGYDRWLASLDRAVELFGSGRVYSAMVAGIELEPAYDLEPDRAADLAVEGAEDLTARGILPVYSLFFPTGGRQRGDLNRDLRTYFERVALGAWAARRRHGLRIWDGFVTRASAYMQLECDLDAVDAAGGDPAASAAA